MRDPVEIQLLNRLLAKRVASRYAARPMKPEKLQALMMKLRKGAGLSVKFKDLIPVFDHLGGWRFDETQTLVPESREYVPVPELRTYSHAHPGNVQTTWEQAKANEVKQLPHPEQVKLYEKVYKDVSEIQTFPNGNTGFTYYAWKSMRATLINAPNRKTLMVAEDIDKVLNDYPTTTWGLDDSQARKRASDWLNKDTPFLDQINEKLGLPSFEAEKERKRTKYIQNDENMGTCPCCFGTFKLTAKTRKGKDKTMPGMVLHGYKRPGTGTVQGNCIGQDWPPFELSREGTDMLVKSLEESIKGSETNLRNLQTGKVETIYDLHRKKKVTKGDPEWEKTLKEEIEGVEHHIRTLDSMLKICQKNLVGWKPTALPQAGDAIKYPNI